MVVIALTDGHRVSVFPRHVAAVESVRGNEEQCVVLMADGTRYTVAMPMDEAAQTILRGLGAS